MQLQQNISLKAYNTFGIDATAAHFVEINSLDDLQAVIKSEALKDLPKLILGGGSNMLFTQNFEGLVIKNSIKGIEQVKEDERHIWLKAMGGEVWHELVLHTIDLDLSGIENLSLIPGFVGAAPMQNIGAYGVELEKVFDSLEAINISTGELRTFTKDECEFGYRESVFKKHLKGQYFIYSVTLRLNKQHEFNVSYGDIKNTLAEMKVFELSVKAVSNAVIKIRQSKLPDPKEIGNAGSFFKNPEISKEHFERLVAQYPVMPSYPLPNGRVKIPAGWLIEQCGWKGKRVGNTGSHARQALVLVNYGNATGAEVKTLAFEIQASVKEKFGIELTPEVNFI
jgi:UDP-N-acetylmuramate dehydrogenase